MGPLAMAQAGVQILGGLKGLFGKKDKAPTPRDNLLSQAQGAREAAEKYGFNPLTMLQYGQTAGAMGGGGGAPPLASVELLTSGLQGLDDVVSGDAARRRAADQLELEMAKIKLDQARSGVIALGNIMPSQYAAVDNVGNSLSPLGGSRATFTPKTVTASSRLGMAENPLAPGREKEVDPVTNSPGFYEVENSLTGGPVSIPGDGEPMELDELATFVGFGAPQAAYNLVKNRYFSGDYWGSGDDKRTIFPRFNRSGSKSKEPSPLLPKGAKTADVYQRIFGRRFGM